MTQLPIPSIRKITLPGGCWPTPEQELLLQAALLPAQEALPAWDKWQASVDFEQDHLDAGSFRLLPLVYHNLRKNIADNPQVGRLRGLHRRTWYENQIHFRACATLVNTLQSAGIKTLVLKGAALVLHYYEDYGARPMGDFDLLVQKQQAGDAFQVLSNAGWKPGYMSVAHLTPDYLTFRHAHPFINKAGYQIDLHWRVLIPCVKEELDRLFWESSIPLQIHDVSTLALNPADQLLHVCVHGVVWSLIPPIRWVADAYTILRKAGDKINWQQLQERAIQGQVSLYTHAALDYLQRTFQVAIPAETLQALRAAPVTRAERNLYRAQTSRSRIFGSFAKAWTRYWMYAEAQRDKNWLQKYLEFPRYMNVIHGYTGWRDLSWYFLTRSIKRSMRILARSE